MVNHLCLVDRELCVAGGWFEAYGYDERRWLSIVLVLVLVIFTIVCYLGGVLRISTHQ